MKLLNMLIVLAALRDYEYTLTNRGAGWWLAPKDIPYKSQDSTRIANEVVNALDAEGVLGFEMPYNTTKGVLKC